jgi:spoIIIJ-associated protein
MVGEDKIEMIKGVVEELLGKLGTAAEVIVSEGEEGGFKVDINGEDLGALIGYHGEGLSALQLFLNLAVHKKLGEWRRILVDIGGYRQEREQKLYELARRTADRVRFLQTPVTLNPMPSFERRLIHMALGEEEGVETESTGERWERRVVVKPAVANNTITQ